MDIYSKIRNIEHPVIYDWSIDTSCQKVTSYKLYDRSLIEIIKSAYFGNEKWLNEILETLKIDELSTRSSSIKLEFDDLCLTKIQT